MNYQPQLVSWISSINSIIQVFRYGIFTYTFGLIFIFDNVVLVRKHGLPKPN